MKDFLNRVSAFFKNAWEKLSDKIKNEKIKNFAFKYWRYFAALAVFLVMILIMVNCAGPAVVAEENEIETETETETQKNPAATFVLDSQFEQDAYEQVNTLIRNYFNSYAAGDIEQLESYAYPISDKEKSYVGICSQYFESYQNVVCYTKHGLTEGSYLVSAYYELKFYDVETAAPGLEFFYVETDENGKLYINNLYCAYNRERMEAEMDSDIYSIYVLYGQQDDVQLIRMDVQERYQVAISTDADLVKMIDITFPLAVEDWKNSIIAIEQSEANNMLPDSEVTTETESVEEQPQEEDLSQEIATEKVRITAHGSVNVRKEPDAASTRLGKASGGSVYTKVGEAEGWVQIDFNGVIGYVTDEYVELVQE